VGRKVMMLINYKTLEAVANLILALSKLIEVIFPDGIF
jgi:hypothetical protein